VRIFFGKLCHGYGVYLFSWVRVDLCALRSTAGPRVGDITGALICVKRTKAGAKTAKFDHG